LADDVKWSLYQHICPNGKVYVGITRRNCEDRWRKGHGYRNNKHFYSAIVKYGWDNIRHDIIYDDLTESEAKDLEVAWIAMHQSDNPLHGYNHSKGGEGKSGFVPTAETREKIRRKLTGTHRPVSVREKVSASHTGKRLSEEHKAKIRASCECINGKKVVCLSTGKVYVSAADASRKTGISSSGITACCRGEIPFIKHTEWAFWEGGAVDGI
jgi:group I intron endonuclease